MQKITTFLMFEGQAEEAVNLYTSLFPDSEIKDVMRYGANAARPEGSLMRAAFVLDGQPFMCFNSDVKHNFTFTPSISLFVHCGTEKEIDHLFAKLSEGGQVMMPLQAYPFSPKFAWLADRFGVSWQLSLVEK